MPISEWERLHREAARYKEMYPKGTMRNVPCLLSYQRKIRILILGVVLLVITCVMVILVSILISHIA